MQVINNIAVWGEPDVQSVAQITEAFKYDALYGALMADHHIGYSVPIGGVLAYDRKICVNGVGYDIACGNKAVRCNMDGDALRKDIYRTMNDVQKYISFGLGRKNNERIEHELFDDGVWGEIDVLKGLKQKSIEQLGTVGSGNHYVDLFVDDLDCVWIGVHFGSRGLGHGIATYFINAAGGKDGMHAQPIVLDEDSDLGQQYIKCMELAGRYAYAGRNWVCSRVARILRADIIEEVHNHHNFAWRERHHDKDVWVVRKGATPNYPGVKSFVGGSMGDYSFILEGVQHPDNEVSMYSTIHGSGRVMGRSQAKGKINRKTNEVIRAGLVSREDMQTWVSTFGVELRGGDVDESPQVYKRIEQVLHAHRNTVHVVHRLKPVGVCMADNRDHDPYKD